MFHANESISVPNKIMGHPVELAHATDFPEDQIKVELFRSLKDGSGFVRGLDVGVNEVYHLQKFPDFVVAEKDYKRNVGIMQMVVEQETDESRSQSILFF